MKVHALSTSFAVSLYPLFSLMLPSVFRKNALLLISISLRYKYITKTYFCFHQRVQVSILALFFLPDSSCELSLSNSSCFTICGSGHKLGQAVKTQLSQHRTVHCCTKGGMLCVCLRHLVISLTGYHQSCKRQNSGSP